MTVDNATYQTGKYKYYLSYLYDDSEQESSLYGLRLSGGSSTYEDDVTGEWETEHKNGIQKAYKDLKNAMEERK